MAKKMAEREDEDVKRAKISQSDFPALTLDQALRISRTLWDNFAGRGGLPHQIAMALELSPTSSGWRAMCGASIAYGLTDGGYNAAQITLTELGRRIVAPVEEGDDVRAMIEAVLRPRILREFFEKYNRAKLPRDDIAQNVLVQMGIPKERAEGAADLLRKNGEAVGIIQITRTGPFVALDAPAPPIKQPNAIGNQEAPGDEEKLEDPPKKALGSNVSLPREMNASNDRVFITHGKNTRIMEQIKKAVTVGGFVPVVSIQKESTAKGVPEKVMEDMRACSAAVIHVAVDKVLFDEDGKPHTQINPNVLIEIGAALALYKDRFILVVPEGLELPSNLQGLYRCQYAGEGLDWDAGVKILEALRGLK